jgi:putative ABC transport system substrate-binding protein
MRLLLSIFAAVILGLTVDLSPASAQEPGRVYRIGWLFLGNPNIQLPAFDKFPGSNRLFYEVLRDKGFVYGKNLTVEIRDAGGDLTRLRGEADALARAGVDIIIAGGTPATMAAMQATRTIPIVFPGVGDPVFKGIIASLARPGGNVTGMAVNIGNPRMWQMLKDVAPHVRRVAGVKNALSFSGPAEARAALYAKADEADAAEAAMVGMNYAPMRITGLEEVEPGFAQLGATGDAGIVIFTDETLNRWQQPIMAAALRHRLPTACAQWFEWAKAGCILTYGEDWVAMRRGAALQIVQILRGTKPADIPVEQPTTFRLVVNVQTAKSLGLAIPASVLAIADEVIE